MSHDPVKLLEDYVAREGHALVPKGHVEEGFPLGQWVSKRRFAYQRGRVDPEASSRLEGLPGWSWSPQKESWYSAYTVLLRFLQREGHAFVRQDVVEDGRRLGVWVWEQRRAYKEGRLSADRICLLGELPGWTWDVPAARWEERLAKLLAFVNRTGHARVPHRHVEDGVALGEWVRAQRRSYHRRTLPEGRTISLERLPGWRWEVRGAGASVRRGRAVPRVNSVDKRSPLAIGLPEHDVTEWVSVDGAAARCGLSAGTIRHLIENGQLPAAQRGGYLRIRRADVDAFVQASRIVPGTLALALENRLPGRSSVS
jgi:excisionase family DNA binding protein